MALIGWVGPRVGLPGVVRLLAQRKADRGAVSLSLRQSQNDLPLGPKQGCAANILVVTADRKR